nr:hypothetical protein [uncultured Dyadobacter sp.]
MIETFRGGHEWAFTAISPSYAYFNIVNLWGKAPLITAYDSTVANNYPSRASVEAIWGTPVPSPMPRWDRRPTQ